MRCTRSRPSSPAANEVIALVRERREEIRCTDLHPVGHAVERDIALRHGKRSGRDVSEVYGRALKMQPRGDTDASAAATEIEDARGFGATQPGLEACLYQLGNRRAGNKHIVVDLEARTREPGLTQQIGHGLPINHAPFEKLRKTLAFRRGNACIQDPVRAVERQCKRAQYQPARLVPRIVRSMPEMQPCAQETTDRPAHAVSQGLHFAEGLLNGLGADHGSSRNRVRRRR
jgi:hypothetical protein